MTANPWMFGLEAVQLGWQAQVGLALKLMRSFAGGVPDQVKESPISPSIVADDTTPEGRTAAPPKLPAAVIDMQESPAAIAAVRRRKTSKVLRASKTNSEKASRVKILVVPGAPPGRARIARDLESQLPSCRRIKPADFSRLIF
jgi:hypothetical protein